ncbi:MAG: polysaccharide biosynthesis C-terminal domain-containing protein [Pseudobutyrivibrio sp.]|nr:polysaccharide biosynthesis C-terminal domain-containing protein [Pseudobutyrivibrio sp.]
MNKLKLFIDNFLVYGIGGLISKLIPLIMISIITWLLPNTDYTGINDMSNTIIQFACAFAILGMYDAMYRLFFEKEDENYKMQVCSTALVFTLFTSVIVFVLMLIFKDIIAIFFLSDVQYANVVYLAAMGTLVSATNSIISAPTRMQNKRILYLSVNAIGPIISYSISIPLVLKGYYVIALPLSSVISGLTIEIAFKIINRKWFKIRLFNKKVLKQLLAIALPLFPNFIIYWIFNYCDKLMITNMIGIGAAGVYAIGSLLGHASQLIYMAFAGGWQFFAFSTMKEKNQVETNSKVFEYLGAISFVAVMFMCALSFPFFHLYKPIYLEGYIVTPYLFFAPLLQMLFQVAANQFLVIKKTWPNLFILLSGAILNIVLNYLLIPELGIEGASIASVIGYIVSDIICVIVLCRMKLMNISKRFIIAIMTTLVFMLMWRFFYSDNVVLGLISAAVFTVIIVILYLKELKHIAGLLKKKKSVVKD